tara:strand:- start:919 stop:2313 length:1395 start_codon:yes stop_codon:yes gene_type:complete
MTTNTIEQAATRSSFVQEFMHALSERNPGENEFLQAVEECIVSLEKVVERRPEYRAASILDRIVEPERLLQFRVTWVDDQGETHVNRGYRVQFNGAIGPYKGGLRFHPSVNRSILKFLGFEQVFKNSLTTQPIGGGKGGSDFDPRGRSDAEVMRFCQAFMTELYRFIGPDTDVPAGDIGVGGREIGYLFGQYRKITNTFTGILTGRDVNWGGSLIRPEATGYGAVYFAADMLETRDRTLEGMECLVSGSGNVAQYTTEKVLDLGGRVLTMSDSTGYVHDPAGIDREKLAWIMDLKNVRRGRISEYADAHDGVTYHEHDLSAGSSPLWNIPAEAAFPSATQNEIDLAAAEAMVNNGVICVSEGANMPTTPEGQHCFITENVLYGPGKAANAGGVAVSALEMAQGSQRMYWSREEVDRQLKAIMGRIHRASLDAAAEYGVPGNYLHGANIAGFCKVADAMVDQGSI